MTNRVLLDDFSDNRFTWPVAGAGGGGTFIVTETNQQLTIGGSWKSPTTKIADTCVWAFPVRSWEVQNGRTLEARVELVSLSPAATFAMVSLYHTWEQGYDFSLANGWVAIWKDDIPRVTCFYAEKVAIRTTNVVLILSLTPVGQNTILTGKVLDKMTGAVLYEKSVLDTPASDPSLSAQQLADLTGCRAWQDVGTDVAGAPWKDGVSPVLYVVQDTDGKKPPATATFAKFELRTYEVPQVSIERAVQLSFPATAGVNYTGCSQTAGLDSVRLRNLTEGTRLSLKTPPGRNGLNWAFGRRPRAERKLHAQRENACPVRNAAQYPSGCSGTEVELEH